MLSKELSNVVLLRTIRIHLKDIGFSTKIPRRKPYLTNSHKKARFSWAMKNINNSEEGLEKIIWSDDLKFSPIMMVAPRRFGLRKGSEFENGYYTTTKKFRELVLFCGVFF